MKITFTRQLRIYITIAFLVYLATKIEFDRLFDTLSTVSFFGVLLALIVFVFIRVLMGLRWKVILSAYGISIKLSDVIKIIFISMPAGIITPGGVGMDFARGYLISKQYGQMEDVAGSIILDRIIGLYTMFLVAYVAVLIAPNFEYSGQITNILLLCNIGFVFGGVCALYLANCFNFNIKIGTKKGLIRKIYKLLESLSDFTILKKILLTSVLLSILVQLSRCTFFFFIYLSLGELLEFSYFLLFIPLVFVILFLPISIGGIGVRETALLYFFSQADVLPEISVSAGLIAHIFQFLIVIPGIILFLKNKNIN